MPRFFTLTTSEVHFLQCFLELPSIHGMEAFSEPSRDNLLACVKSLAEKSYLLEDPQGGYYLDSTLNLLFRVASNPWGHFHMAGTDTQCTIYFLNDCIAVCTCSESHTEFMWLPILPLAIGHIANLIGTFLNPHSEELLTVPGNEFDSLAEKFRQDGYQMVWDCTVHEAELPENDAGCCIMSNGHRQLLLCRQGEQAIASAPCKADLVNALTRMFAPVHGRAIRAGGELNGND